MISLKYWKEQLANAPGILELPMDRQRSSGQTFRKCVHSWNISHDLTESLQTLARKEQTTLFPILLTAFVILLHRYSNQEKIVIGSTTFDPHSLKNGNDGEQEKGLLPLCADISENRSEEHTSELQSH